MRYKMKIIIKKRYKYEITNEIIENIIKSLNFDEPFSIEYQSGDGRCIIIEKNNKKIYIILSRKIADARNAYLAQYIPTVLEQYIEDQSVNKEIYIYLLDTSDKAKTPFIIDTYRIAKTLDINILNENELFISPIVPYNSFFDWKNAKTNRQNYNLANNSSYVLEDDDEYFIYGKLYGANGKESTFMACQIAQIAKIEQKKVNFIQVKEHGTEAISITDQKLLEHYGINILMGSIILNGKQYQDKSTCRKQDEFRFNLLEKYGTKKCYLCECDIESNIIASHIHRITDIDNSTLNEEEKRHQAVDANNGFWLCANHDKMFEHGIVTFDENGNLLIKNNLQKHQKDFIDYITKIYKIQGNHFTESLKNYLNLHNKRINK